LHFPHNITIIMIAIISSKIKRFKTNFVIFSVNFFMSICVEIGGIFPLKKEEKKKKKKKSLQNDYNHVIKRLKIIIIIS